MAAGELQTLVGRLNPACRQALERAVALAMKRQHYNVEIEHWMLQLAESPSGDIAAIMRHFSADPSRLIADLTRVLDRFKTGNSRTPALAPNVTRLVREAWVFASLQRGETAVRSGHLLSAFLSDEALGAIAREDSRQLGHLKADELRTNFDAAVAGSDEGAGGPAAADGAAAAKPDAPPVAAAGKSALDQYTTNLTQRARDGHIDPVLGRDAEIRQVIDVLTRRRQNNPILTGEAGVGKTAVVEGFALKIARGDVPAMLKDVEIHALDLGLLQAGAAMKGEFEGRLKAVIDAVKSSPRPIITFIDEAHTLIGAGGAAGTGDAANLLKPALARGEMRTIAATTWAEYKKYFEKDPALTRRFQVVKVEEPGDEAAIAMMRGIVPTLEKHHGVRILAEAAEEAVRLSRRYIPSRQLPDKAVSLLDTAAGRVAVGHAATPAMVEDRQRRIELLDHRLGVFEREQRAGGDYDERIREATEERERVAAELAELETQWAAERDLVDRLRALRAEAEASQPGAGAAAAEPAPRGLPDIRAEFAKLDRELLALQGDRPLMRVAVDGQAIAEVVANWTGIPVGRMQSDQVKTMMRLEDQLAKRVIGQPQALSALAETVRTSRAKLADPRKPIGVFLMVGTSGVGKTETALALAELLYGGEQNMTVINMSEFKEEHKVSTLMGSPPGYVGYGEGGVLTEAVRRRPYSVVLLDEVEKAHPGVQDVFYQVFDKGMLRDGEGRDIDFKNTIVIMTSNAGTDLIQRLCRDQAALPSAEDLAEALHPELLKTFKPAFLGRCAVIPYFPLSDEVIRQIIALQLQRIRQRFRDNYKVELDWEPDVIEAIAERCTEVGSGARNIEYILSRNLLPSLSARILQHIADGDTIPDMRIGIAADGSFSFTEVGPASTSAEVGEDRAAAE